MILLLLAATVLLARTVSLMLGPLLAALAGAFGTSVAVAGQLASGLYMTWGIGASLVGPVSEIYGGRRIALAGLGIIPG